MKLEQLHVEYVKVALSKFSGAMLLYYYPSNEIWDLPAGRIGDGESKAAAAARELLERTGYEIDQSKLHYIGSRNGFNLYCGDADDAERVGDPRTKIKWGHADVLHKAHSVY